MGLTDAAATCANWAADGAVTVARGAGATPGRADGGDKRGGATANAAGGSFVDERWLTALLAAVAWARPGTPPLNVPRLDVRGSAVEVFEAVADRSVADRLPAAVARDEEDAVEPTVSALVSALATLAPKPVAITVLIPSTPATTPIRPPILATQTCGTGA